MGMRILITGGAGCLGSNLIEHWLPKGHEIFVIDNFSTGKQEVLPQLPGLTVVEGSIADNALVEESFKYFNPTHVIHSAAAYSDPDNWAEDTATNVLGTIHVAKAAFAHGVKKLINFQTVLCYGRPEILPVPVTHPTGPFTSYGISKTAGEAYLMQSGLPVVSLRLGNICAPRLSIGPIPTFYKRLKAGQTCFCSDTVRDFLDIQDFLNMMDILMKNNEITGVFNVSTGEGHSIKEVFDVVVNYLGLESSDVPIIPPEDNDVQAMVLDPRETEKIFNWKAEISFKETIEKQLRWYDAHGITDIYSHLRGEE